MYKLVIAAFCLASVADTFNCNNADETTDLVHGEWEAGLEGFDAARADYCDKAVECGQNCQYDDEYQERVHEQKPFREHLRCINAMTENFSCWSNTTCEQYKGNEVYTGCSYASNLLNQDCADREWY